MPQILPPQDKCITEIWQQWTPTPYEDHITIPQDLPQELQVNTVELSFDLHFPNVTQQRINAPPVVHNDRVLKKFLQSEERCLKFINQDLMFLQESHIPSPFTNVSHTTTSLKELVHTNVVYLLAKLKPFEQKEHFSLKEQNGLVWNLAYVRNGTDLPGDRTHNLQVGGRVLLPTGPLISFYLIPQLTDLYAQH